MTDRLAAARDYVAKKPTDRFGLYALAMELRKLREFVECFATFERLIAAHPDYAAGYYHYGAARRESGDRAAALDTLRRGLAAAERSRDTHTHAELESLIEELE